jgi:TolB-like protein
MRYAFVSVLLTIFACASVQGRGASPPRAQPHYRVGKAPKPEFKVGGKGYKIDPEAANTKQVRALPPEHFDPTTRRQRVETFYRDALKDHYEESLHGPRIGSGPFRHEFMHWARRWPAAMRARWAWHNRVYIEDALWAEWMADPAFAAEIDSLQRQKVSAVVGYLPPEYAATSPVLVYNDEFLNAAYNPVPFLAVLTLKSLKPDEKTDWIGTAAAESLETRLSSTPGLFLAERERVMEVLHDQTLRETHVAATQPAAQIGKALDVERVLVGSYVVDGDDVLFNLRIVDVQTGAVETGISKTVSREHLLAAMPDLASSVAAALGYPPQEEFPVLAGPMAAQCTPALAKRGKLLFADDFSRAEPTQKWRVGLGFFTVNKGMVSVAENPADHHSSVAEVTPSFQFKDIVVDFSVKLEGARSCGLFVKDSKYNQSRAGLILKVVISDGKVRLDDSKFGAMRNDIYEKMKDLTTTDDEKKRLRDSIKDKSAEFKMDSDLSQWHAFRVEIVGEEMLVSIDGKPAGYLKSRGIEHRTKNNIGFEVGGSSVAIKDMRISEATASSDWSAQRDAVITSLKLIDAGDKSAPTTVPARTSLELVAPRSAAPSSPVGKCLSMVQ